MNPPFTQARPLIEIENLSVEFKVQHGTVSAIRDVSFTIPRGKTVALVGESGSGKSVTSQAIMGILPTNGSITSGAINYAADDGQIIDIASLNPRSKAMQDLRGDRISIIFQEPMVSLSPVHTLLGQIGEVLQLHTSLTKKQIRAKVTEMLDKVGFPDPERALNQYAFELSGGLRQRAMIAMALICQPALLIADEPTTALDVTVQAQILLLIKSLQAEFGMSVLLITHDLGVVANMADDVVVMFQGEIVERGPIKALFSNPGHPYLQALFTALPELNMERHTRLQPLRDIVHDTSGMNERRQVWTQEQRDVAPHLKVDLLNKSYYSRHGTWIGRSTANHAVKDFSMEIAVGESFGLVGESGCGKTSLSKLLMRAMPPDSGSIVYNDRGRTLDLLSLSNEEMAAFRPKMQFVFQDPFSSLNPRMTVLDILREPLIIHGRGDKSSQLQQARELMGMVGLDQRFLTRYPHSFSGGQRQRISIARALALEPDFLILDEPVSALDVSVQAQILNLLQDLQHELHLTYMFISHNLAVIDYISDRVGVMCGGQLVEVAPREQLLKQPQHPYTQALYAAIPYADLNKPLNMHNLDRKHLLADSWEEPYRLAPGQTSQLVETEPNHFVRRTL